MMLSKNGQSIRRVVNQRRSPARGTDQERNRPEQPKSRFIFQTAAQEVVIPRACGVSSTPQLLGSIMDGSEYWIARFR
jgi:hypothetical protein